MRLVLLGPPGVGKGTQGRRLAAEKGWALISTGEILRGAVARKTSIGIEAQKRMDEGLLVPDDVMIALVRERSAEADARAMLQTRGLRLDVAVGLAVPEDELVRRLGARRECPVCKRAYNLETAPPRDGRHCDDHPEVDLIQRVDDAEATIRRRLDVYRTETAPLMDYYRGQGRLREIPGLGPMDDVYRSLTKVLGCRA